MQWLRHCPVCRLKGPCPKSCLIMWLMLLAAISISQTMIFLFSDRISVNSWPNSINNLWRTNRLDCLRNNITGGLSHRNNITGGLSHRNNKYCLIGIKVTNGACIKEIKLKETFCTSGIKLSERLSLIWVQLIKAKIVTYRRKTCGMLKLVDLICLVGELCVLL